MALIIFRTERLLLLQTAFQLFLGIEVWIEVTSETKGDKKKENRKTKKR